MTSCGWGCMKKKKVSISEWENQFQDHRDTTRLGQGITCITDSRITSQPQHCMILENYFVNSTSHQSLNKENNNKDYKEVKLFAAMKILFCKWTPLPKQLLFDYTQPDLYHQHWCGNCASYNIHGGSCDPCTSMFSKKISCTSYRG